MVASLAMFAGLALIANTVALAMLERRREIGILKAIGHTSRSMLGVVLAHGFGSSEALRRCCRGPGRDYAGPACLQSADRHSTRRC